MYDLSATMFYKARFHVELKEPATDDLLWKIVLGIRAWLIRKWNRKDIMVVDPTLTKWTKFKLGGRIFDLQNANAVFAESLYHKNKKDPQRISWACKIIERPEPAPGVAPREWVTEIGMQMDSGKSAVLTYVVTYSDIAGFIGPVAEAPSMSVPRLIREVLTDPSLICTIGCNTITDQPCRLDPGSYPDFENVLFNSSREIPVIYISPKSVNLDPEGSRLLVSPVKMADSVVANALVYYSESLDFTSEMRYFGKEKYTCSGGSIRVFAPHINTESEGDQIRHRYLSARYIEDCGEEKILEIFRRAFAQDVHYYESMFRISDCRLLIEHDLHESKIDRIKKKSECDIDEAYSEFLAESDLREVAEKEAQDYKQELDRVKAENFNLGMRIDSLALKAKRCDLAEKASSSLRNIDEYPDTCEKIAQYFETVFADRIVFSDRGRRSLETCIMKNDLFWEVLYHMATDLYDLLHSNSAQAYREFTDRTGWTCARGEGRQTHKDASLMRQYADEFNGQDISIEPHIKNGAKESDPKFIRVHFAYDPMVADKIIIGHCGDHLDNYSTRKVS